MKFDVTKLKWTREPADYVISEDRIEIITIGGLVRGISFDDVMLGVSVLRNEHLANVFYRLKLIEAYGTGMLKINESYADYEVKPKIEVTNHAFKITLPNTNFILHDSNLEIQDTVSGKENLEKTREEIVISLFEDRDSIVRKDVEDILKVSQATAILVLRKMVEKGILLKEGGGKCLKYSVNAE